MSTDFVHFFTWLSILDDAPSGTNLHVVGTKSLFLVVSSLFRQHLIVPRHS